MKIVIGDFNVKTLLYVHSLLVKYAHVRAIAKKRNRVLPTRMQHWINYYDSAIFNYPGIWREFCDQVHLRYMHDSDDLMA